MVDYLVDSTQSDRDLAAAIFVPGKLLSKVAGTLSPHCHVIVLLFSTLHTWDMEARFDQMSHGLEEAKANETKVKNENKALRGEYGKMYSCSWTPQPGQCMGLSQLDRVWTAKDCREVCCRMGPEICSTWQFDGKSSECWLGTPTDCSDDDDGWAGGRLSSA